MKRCKPLTTNGGAWLPSAWWSCASPSYGLACAWLPFAFLLPCDVHLPFCFVARHLFLSTMLRTLLRRISAGSMLVRCENNVHDRNESITQKNIFVRQHELRITFFCMQKEKACEQNVFRKLFSPKKISCTPVCSALFLSVSMGPFFALTYDLDEPIKSANVYSG